MPLSPDEWHSKVRCTCRRKPLGYVPSPFPDSTFAGRPLLFAGFNEMKRTILSIGLCLAAGGWTLPAQAQGTPQTSETVALDAAAWAVADSTTGVILDSANASKKLQIGSITKIATAMVVLDWAAAKGEN